MLYRFHKDVIRLNWQLGLILILLFGVPRFILVLQASVTGQYNLVSIIFVLMWISPWVLLNKKNRKLIGIRKPDDWTWLIPSFIAGMAFCILLYFIGKWLFFDTHNNWFIYLSKPYQEPLKDIAFADRFPVFVVFAIIGMTFSPIGEELMYRGLIHQCFVGKYGSHGASLIDSTAFAITHLAHFGIVFISGRWLFLWLPAIFWVLFMFLVSRMFYYLKIKTGSILGPIVSHAGFNLAMTYLMVFYIL